MNDVSRHKETPSRRRSVPRPLDPIDHTILNLLQTDSDRSNADLARRVRLSASGLKKRLLKLRRRGIIQRRVTLVDRHAVDFGLLCFVQVVLTHHEPDTVLQFRDVVASIPEVMECHFVTGEHDYLLKIVARDNRDLERILAHELAATPGVDRVSTSIVLNEVKRTTALPLGARPEDAALAS